jgi:hypothetical protein
MVHFPFHFILFSKLFFYYAAFIAICTYLLLVDVKKRKKGHFMTKKRNLYDDMWYQVFLKRRFSFSLHVFENENMSNDESSLYLS